MNTKKILATVLASVTVMGSVAALPEGYFENISNSVTVSAADSSIATVVMKEKYSCVTNAIRINWNKVENASGYRVYRYNMVTKKWTKVATVIGTTTYRDTDLLAGTVYKYKVKAYKLTNGKTTAGLSSSTFSATTKPSKVKITKTSSGLYGIRLNWAAQSCMGYKIYQLRDNKWYEIGSVDGTETTFRVNGLTPGTSNSYMITAYSTDKNGKTVYSNYSKSVTAATKDDPTKADTVVMPEEVVGLSGKAITVSTTTNIGDFKISAVKPITEGDVVSYSYTIDGDVAKITLKEACTVKFKFVLYSAKGTRAVCYTYVTAK